MTLSVINVKHGSTGRNIANGNHHGFSAIIIVMRNVERADKVKTIQSGNGMDRNRNLLDTTGKCKVCMSNACMQKCMLKYTMKHAQSLKTIKCWIAFLESISGHHDLAGLVEYLCMVLMGGQQFYTHSQVGQLDS
jgi:hypothetical protein